MEGTGSTKINKYVCVCFSLVSIDSICQYFNFSLSQAQILHRHLKLYISELDITFLSMSHKLNLQIFTLAQFNNHLLNNSICEASMYTRDVKIRYNHYP